MFSKAIFFQLTHVLYKILPMTGFEMYTTYVGSYHSTNWTTNMTSVLSKICTANTNWHLSKLVLKWQWSIIWLFLTFYLQLSLKRLFLTNHNACFICRFDSRDYFQPIMIKYFVLQRRNRCSIIWHDVSQGKRGQNWKG